VPRFADELEQEQLNWRPEGYSTSIGFHLWHLARESDYLKAAILQHYPGLDPEVEDAGEIWIREDLVHTWGFPPGAHEIDRLDARYQTFENVNDEQRKKIEMTRLNLLVFLTHNCRHLGMMECLKALQTGFGSATEKRK